MAPFDDVELERYYQLIEARTRNAQAPPRRRVQRGWAAPRSDEPTLHSTEECPTPGKTGHLTSRDAWLAVSVLRASRFRPPQLDVYHCRCGLWHITSRASD